MKFSLENCFISVWATLQEELYVYLSSIFSVLMTSYENQLNTRNTINSTVLKLRQQGYPTSMHILLLVSERRFYVTSVLSAIKGLSLKAKTNVSVWIR